MVVDNSSSLPKDFYTSIQNPSGYVDISCQVFTSARKGSSTFVSTISPIARQVQPILFLIIICVCGFLTFIKELVKVWILLYGLCYPSLRSVGHMVVTLNSPLIVFFCFSEYYRWLIALTSKSVRSTRLVAMDLIFDSGL